MPVEGKFDPTLEQQSFVSRKGLEEWASSLISSILDDDKARWSWLQKQAHYWRRRYGKEFRNTDWPWPNASDIVMPVLDMAVDRLKPVFIQSTLGTRPIVTLIARNPRSMPLVGVNEQFLDWLIETRIPDAAEQIAYGADHYLQHGHAVFKVFYDYQTSRVTDVITRDRLPREISDLLAGESLTDEQRNAIFATTSKTLISRAELGGMKEQLAALVRKYFALSDDDPDDKKAETTILNWLVKGKEDYVTVKMRSVTSDTPRFVAIAPENLVVADYVTDIQTARRITHRLFLTEEEIRRRARDSGWSKKAVDVLLRRDANGQPIRRPSKGSLPESSLLEYARDEVSGVSAPRLFTTITQVHKDLYEIWEVYTYLDLDNDGFAEKVVVTLDPTSQAVLRLIELPFKHGKWPFVQVKFEHNDPRFYRSRGVPEKLDDLDVEITAQHRAKLNRMTIANAPVFLYRMGSKVNPGTFRFIPGQFYPVTNINDVASLAIPNLDISFEREEQVLGSWVERYIGTLDVAISEQGKLTRPRTATEIQAVGSLQAQISGSRILLWQKGWTRVLNMIWDLWNQYGPPEVFFRVTGADPEELTRFTRADIQADFDFVPTPSALNNPMMRVQTAQMQFVTLSQVPPEAWGKTYEVNLGEAALAFLEAVDARNARRIVRRRSAQELAALEAAEKQARTISLDGSQGIDTKAATGIVSKISKRAQSINEPIELEVQ